MIEFNGIDMRTMALSPCNFLNNNGEISKIRLLPEIKWEIINKIVGKHVSFLNFSSESVESQYVTDSCVMY